MNAPALVSATGWALLHFVWQGAVVGCATALALTALRNARPETRYAVACLGLLLCLAWPAAALVLSLRAGPDGGGAGLGLRGLAAGTGQDGAAGMLPWLQAHLDWVVGLWAACAGALALRMALGLLWIARAGRGEAADPVWQARLSQMAARFGLGRDVRLRVVDGLASPITAGWWRPLVLVPASLVSGMAPQLLEALLAHELGHVKRHDYLVNLLQNVIETLLFYHPAVWWISHRIRIEREQIADDFAARQLGEPRRLALALSELERLQFSSHHLAQAANGGDLMARIRRLLRPDTQALNWKAAIPVLGLAVACAASAHALEAGNTAGKTDGAASHQRSRGALLDFSSCARPHYPRADLKAGHQGTVTLRFLVDAGGKVGDSKIVRSSGYPTLDEAAHSALVQCSFRPALEQGRAVRKWAAVQYVWTLN
jgi:D-alanyl-D-alanine endopeptidase (penicillin-binding protein 7)